MSAPEGFKAPPEASGGHGMSVPEGFRAPRRRAGDTA
jgi:hypothetical protein